MRGRFDDADRDLERRSWRDVSLEQWGDDAFDHGFAGDDDHLHGDGDERGGLLER